MKPFIAKIEDQSVLQKGRSFAFGLLRSLGYEDEVSFKFTVRDSIYTSSSKTALKANGLTRMDHLAGLAR